MDKVSGDAAEAALAEAWEKILGQDPAGQEIVHVLAQPSVEPAWVTEFPVFRVWMANGREASDEIWESFAEVAHSWPYIVNARRACAAGIPNTRIFLYDTSAFSGPTPMWLQYLLKVHLPAISAMSGERLYKTSVRDFKDRPGWRAWIRRHDVNLFGAAGVMMAGGDNGDVEWRAFVDEADDPELFHQEREYVLTVRDVSIANREPAELPLIA